VNLPSEHFFIFSPSSAVTSERRTTGARSCRTGLVSSGMRRHLEVGVPCCERTGEGCRNYKNVARAKFFCVTWKERTVRSQYRVSTLNELFGCFRQGTERRNRHASRLSASLGYINSSLK
jgi:hypothetical protein